MVGSLYPDRTEKELLLPSSRSGRQRTVALVGLARVLARCQPFSLLNFTQSHPLHAAGSAMMGHR